MRTILRLLDANANRAGEAIRVLEDVARFVLDDREIASELKSMRHDLRTALDAVGATADRLLAARDTPGDVGTTLSTPTERTRANTRAIVHAAGKRLTEALRAMEEAAKTLPGGTDSSFERLRYRAYSVEPRLLASLPPPCPQWALCVLLTESLCAHHPWERVADLAIRGGAGCLQLREKSLTDRELLARARALVEIADGRAAVIVNDRPDLAVLAGAAGVHLGQTDLRVADARRVSGELLVGVSCATADEARNAVADRADYVGLGPMFSSTTKPKPLLPGPDLIRAVVADPLTSEIPHLAISGIDAARAADLAAAGCRGVAVSGAVCSAEDPEAAAQQIAGAFAGLTDHAPRDQTTPTTLGP